MTTCDNPDIRQVVLYYLNLFHTIEEVKEMEHSQFPGEFKRWWRQQGQVVELMVEMWDPCGCTNNFDFFHDKKVWRNWL